MRNKTNKEVRNYLIEKDNKFRLKYGGNGTEGLPDVLYLRSKVRVTPTVKGANYIEAVAKLKKQSKDFVESLVNSDERFEKKHIFLMTLAENSITYGKGSHLTYELYVKPVVQKSVYDYKDELVALSDVIETKFIEFVETCDLIIY